MAAGRKGEDTGGGRKKAEEGPCVFGDKMHLDTCEQTGRHLVLQPVLGEGQAGRQSLAMKLRGRVRSGKDKELVLR